MSPLSDTHQYIWKVLSDRYRHNSQSKRHVFQRTVAYQGRVAEKCKRASDAIDFCLLCIPWLHSSNTAVFLYTYWDVPRWYVIYNVTCALGPYCMAREPVFLDNTWFLIDSFHMECHTRCSPACFINTYRNELKKLAFTNLLAAECGNSGLLRVCKQLAYMNYKHVILYLMVFLAI